MTYQNANKNSHLRKVAAYKESTVFPQLTFSQKYIKYISEKMVLKIILVQGFCPLKIKITQFPDGFRLNILLFFDIPFHLELEAVE